MASLRRMQLHDLVAYQALMVAGLRAHPDRFRLTEDDIAAEPPPLADEAGGFTVLAEIDGALVGAVSVRREARYKCRHKALLYRMYVNGSCAGRGIGRQLLDVAITRARDIEGLRHLNLTVLAENAAAIHPYSSAGFETFAVEPQAVLTAGRYHDELQMKRVLDA